MPRHMNKPITSEIVVAYAHCPLKGYLLLCTDEIGLQHEYVGILERQRQMNQARYNVILAEDHQAITASDQTDLKSGKDYLIGLTLHARGLTAEYAALTRVPTRSSLGNFSYEPTIVTATDSLTNEHKLQIAFAGLVLGYIQTTVPTRGTVVGLDEHRHAIDLRKHYKPLGLLLNPLKQWADAPPIEPPPVILNKHCPTCQFRTRCRDKAEKADDLSLLDRMTPKSMRRYHRKGIFTITQLSYLFRPRKSRKRPTETTVAHKLELQALALRMGKTYLQESPGLSRQPTELFLDIEGNPDRRTYYLIGLQVREGHKTAHHSFWADTTRDEKTIWDQFLAITGAYPDAPIYHYGSYETAAVERMARRYPSDGSALKKRLVNLTTHVYGKVYFPVRSNSLKDIGRFLGATWSSPDASGLQSLVWRHRWEDGGSPDDKQHLIVYNKEDCDALARLVDELDRIRVAADALPDIDFADAPKRMATEQGARLHGQFETILLSAHATYDRTKIDLSRHEGGDTPHKKRGAQKGHPGHHRATPTRPGIIRHIPPRETCPRCAGEPLRATAAMATAYTIDLVFTKNGCRKAVTRYVGPKAYCRMCQRSYRPPGMDKSGSNALFGHGFQSWVIYQRLVLRLPYRVIVQVLEDQFNERMSETSIVNFLSYFFSYYSATEERIVQAILRSPFIHVDETKINIEGIDQYVWVFTDGTHVFFKLTKTREAAIVHEILSGYDGILISDFYGGYDAVACRQQKCLVHLIRDLNQDLWDRPFDGELERFVGAVGDLIAPILADARRYGLKARHFGKHRKRVDAFYATTIDRATYTSEVVITYQKRFDRYRGSLFTFLEHDGIPWNNNMAERSIRHLAVQRKISGTFFASVAPHYLRLLGIMQTCRFQGKSLLKFLVSGETDIDAFKPLPRTGRA
jgi:predicted RecB family nuclease